MNYNQLHEADPYTYPPIGDMTEEEAMELARQEARSWRDIQLFNTDHIVPLTDHPDHSSTLAYRVALRDWPSTSDFPNTKPTL